MKSALHDWLELKRKEYEYYKVEESRHIYHRPAIIKIILNTIKPEVRVNIRELKHKLRTINVDNYNGNVRAMLLNVELLHD